ncbi:hypothetical protein NL50_03505 [Clostridium acetobutylicum]|nr:hypothetical protein NL50_03505 [Clostridium acetobutylicum]
MKKRILVTGIIVLIAAAAILLFSRYKSYVLVKHEEYKYSLYLKVKDYNIFSDGLTVYPQNDLNKIFYVKKEKYSYRDGYVYRLIEPQIKERIEGLEGNDFSNLKFSVVASHGNDGLLSVSDYDYKEIPDIENFFEKENETLVTVKSFVSYGTSFNKTSIAEEIKNFVSRVTENRFSNKNINISFEFFLVSKNCYERINSDSYRFKDRKDIVKSEGIKKAVYIKCKNGIDSKDINKIVFTNY